MEQSHAKNDETSHTSPHISGVGLNNYCCRPRNALISSSNLINKRHQGKVEF